MIRNYIEPRGWEAPDIRFVIGKVAQHYKLSADEVVDSSMDKRGRTAFPVATDKSSFELYLDRMDAAMLAELIPDDTRRLLISRYVSKVEEFWSPGRCSLIKTSIRISISNWVWLRQLLGRSVDEKGELIDHCFDGVRLPMLRGKYTLNRVAEESANTQQVNPLGSAESHGGLVSFRNAR